MNTASTGKVYLIGAGPGAQDLITLRGARLLAAADVVLHDALVTSEMLELCPQAVKIPVGKRCGQLSTAQAFINKQLVDSAHKYALVVRLNGKEVYQGTPGGKTTEPDQAGVEVELRQGENRLWVEADYSGEQAAVRLADRPARVRRLVIETLGIGSVTNADGPAQPLRGLPPSTFAVLPRTRQRLAALG